MPPLMDLVPRIEISNQNSWEHIFDWYLNFQTARQQITPKIQSLVNEVTARCKNEDEKIAALYHWVQRKIRYISVKGGASSGVSGHPAEETLENGYGDCTDKSILFSTMLRAAGIESFPVYVRTNDSGKIVKDIPSYVGNHCIVQIFPKTGQYFFLDPVSENSRYPSFWDGSHGTWALCAQKKEFYWIPVPPSEREARLYSYEINLRRNGTIDVLFIGKYRGNYETAVRYYWQSKKEKERKQQIQTMLADISPEAKLKSYELKNLYAISKPLCFTIRYQAKNFAKKAGNLFIFTLPEIPRRYENFPEVSLKERKYDIVYPSSRLMSNRVRIKLPRGIKPEWVPEPLHLRLTDLVSYQGEYKVEDGLLIFEDKFKRNGRVIPREYYQEYKQLIIRIQQWIKKPVLLK